MIILYRPAVQIHNFVILLTCSYNIKVAHKIIQPSGNSQTESVHYHFDFFFAAMSCSKWTEFAYKMTCSLKGSWLWKTFYKNYIYFHILTISKDLIFQARIVVILTFSYNIEAAYKITCSKKNPSKRELSIIYVITIDCWFGKGAFKYYISAFFWGEGRLSQNADTADTLKGRGGRVET